MGYPRLVIFCFVSLFFLVVNIDSVSAREKFKPTKEERIIVVLKKLNKQMNKFGSRYTYSFVVQHLDLRITKGNKNTSSRRKDELRIVNVRKIKPAKLYKNGKKTRIVFWCKKGKRKKRCVKVYSGWGSMSSNGLGITVSTKHAKQITKMLTGLIVLMQL